MGTHCEFQAAICTRTVSKCFYNAYRNPISAQIGFSDVRLFASKSPSNASLTGLSEDGFLPCFINVRFYSKAKDRSKGDKKKKIAVLINRDEIQELVDFAKFESELENALDQLKADYVKNLSLRSNLGSIENLPVVFEGDTFSLQELAQITKKGPQLLVVNVSSFPTAVSGVVKAINESGMGLNPQQDGAKVFIQIPKVTKEHREQLAKNAKVMFQKFKDRTRDVQNKYVREVKKKEKDVSADTAYAVQQHILSCNEKINNEGENIMLAKQKELLQKD